FGHKSLVEFFMNIPDHIIAHDHRERTPLHWAALGGRVCILKMLFGKRNTIQAQDKIGRTALHCAASEGHTHAVRWLIENDADYLEKDQRKRTPLKLA
ncbi:ankyrin, partial [Hyaloscypha bicolor E]